MYLQHTEFLFVRGVLRNVTHTDPIKSAKKCTFINEL